MKPDLNQLEALQKQKYIESKIDMVPASLKEIKSAIGNKEAVLVARELIINDRIVIGIEYTPEGDVASAYTSDENGKRIMLENTRETAANLTSANLISQRLEAANSLTQEKAAKTVETPAVKKVRPAQKQLTGKDLQQLKEYQQNRRGC